MFYFYKKKMENVIIRRKYWVCRISKIYKLIISIRFEGTPISTRLNKKIIENLRRNIFIAYSLIHFSYTGCLIRVVPQLLIPKWQLNFFKYGLVFLFYFLELFFILFPVMYCTYTFDILTLVKISKSIGYNSR